MTDLVNLPMADLMKSISYSDRLSDVVFCAAMFKAGHIEGEKIFGIVLRKTWDNPTEQELFDRMLHLFLNTPDVDCDFQ